MAGEPDVLGAFDEDHPPSRSLADDCVHCGFCLPSCPTYVLWGEEMDSPRGRIHLIQQGLDGEPLTDAMAGHIDACLGCLACVTACPSGVRYDELLNATRAQVERRHPRSRGERLLRALVFGLFPYPRRLRLLRAPLAAYRATGADRLGHRLARHLPPALATMEELAPPARRAPRLPPRVRARGRRRATVGLLTGCVQSAFFGSVSAATARVLALEGCEVLVPRRQGCCGALSAHTGRRAEAARFARATIDAFDAAGVDYVVTDSAGCGSAMKEYAELLADDPRYAGRAERLSARTRDVTELLVELGPVAQRHPVRRTVAYHDACHLAHAQKIRSAPRQLLRGIPELTLVEPAEAELCCGSAGVYNLLEPEPARELGDRKAARIRATGADLLVAGNPGCLLQITAALRRAGTPLPTAHTVELLDASLRGPVDHGVI
ncbi:glycolate oxidase iron-sulfur subunit [Actinocatenispora thailandica]|uniref:Glycolate oxidase iron-sulfur subunit n=1 Tax=Actinocatenispora thailandica TaxID=227318 RepID=A0A7R7DUS5_9ACTN|nr:heterodisulfide reductase-related iron-sulfur binding cluster [Actinocatenispora thailandica]BCJ38235.1 glycolate oxidase iron-sulfur subunit [Actinocatenispora thailandica]